MTLDQSSSTSRLWLVELGCDKNLLLSDHLMAHFGVKNLKQTQKVY